MTSREQFETAWQKNNECEPMDGWESLRCDDGYTDEIIDGQWWAWQASREAVEIELPDTFQDQYSSTVMLEIDVVAAIEKHGIKVNEEGQKNG
ncbi:hypothetical protein [Hafnia paralvei]|uniref:hypothetical protein n=1 Tax=Hafnia paralvei TaxID=546367 RepID=UPI0039AF3EA9